MELSTALASLKDADFAKIRTTVSPPGKAPGVWVSVFDFLENVAKKKNPHEVLRRLENQTPEVLTFCESFKFPGRGQHDTPICTLASSLKLLQLTPGEAGREARSQSAELLCRYYGGDLSLVRKVFGNAVEQERLAVEDPTNPMGMFGVDLAARNGAALPCALQFHRPRSQAQKTLPEPSLNWQLDLGAKREEIPAAKAIMKALFEIEVAAGALPRVPQPNCSAPQTRFRGLADAALQSSRISISRRLGTMAAPSGKKRRFEEAPQSPEALELPDAPETLPDALDDALRVSEVMAAAGVWDAVWKAYMSDLANRMVQLKVEETEGAFSERRDDVHSYKKGHDWPLAWQAVRETKDLYEKRAREFLEAAFSAAGVYDEAPACTYAGVCAEAARRLANQLVTG